MLKMRPLYGQLSLFSIQNSTSEILLNFQAMEITLNLPERIYRDVSTVAQKSQRRVVDLIVEVVQEKYSAPPLERPLADYSDEEVLALARL